MGRVMALLVIVTGGLIVADLWAHPAVTNQVLKTSQTVAGYVAGK